MEPPLLLIQSCGGAPSGLGEELPARGHALVYDDGVFGQHGPQDGGNRGRRDCAGRKRRPAWRRDPGRRRAHGTEFHGQGLEGGFHVFFEAGQLGGFGILGHQQAGLVRIGEERDGLARSHQHQVPCRPHHAESPLDDVGNALDLDAAGASLQPGIGAFGQDTATGLGGDPPRQLQTGMAQGIATHQQGCSFAAAQHGGSRLDGIVGHLWGAVGGAVSAMPSAAPQAVSAGRIKVAICPGVCRAASIAKAPSAATVPALGEVLTQCDMGAATPSMSEVSGASWAM